MVELKSAVNGMVFVVLTMANGCGSALEVVFLLEDCGSVVV